MIGPETARALWREFETLHAVTYFDEAVRSAFSSAGCKGFWMGYFGARAAPMGAVAPGVVAAAFANFAPRMVERAVPDVWQHASPAALLDVRASACAQALRATCADIETTSQDLLAALAAVVDASDPTGRPLCAANRDVRLSDDPVAALWQCCTVLREHRGDGHVAACVANGLSGLDAHLLQVAAGVVPADRLREARGWTEDEWSTAHESLVRRGLLGNDGAMTDDGRAVKDRVESVTDALAAEPWRATVMTIPEVLDRLRSLADGVRAASVIPVPNPIGLA